MAQGGMVLVKYLLFFFNLIFWISGIVLMGIGAWIKLKYKDLIQLSESNAATGAVFLIIIGVIVAIVGFLGCCGAWKENYCMVTTVLLEEVTKKALDEGIKKYFKGGEEKKAIDNVQEKFECCGVDGYEDYLNQNTTELPESCCRTPKCNTTVEAMRSLNNTEIYTQGCLKGFEKFLREHLLIVGGVGIGIAFVQLIGIVFACCLMRSIKQEYEVV
ncbi:CD63 antigen-like [Stylophora pistillata]|uniref:CD63 antigen-like n=1 Tax=Stylophora pistillata TaxID=50429 RepID=UPI000C03C8F6|nr:CD63 antigen-like [Stylophora pistillata]